MQIVIDIDENVFTRLFDNGTEDYEIVNDDLFAIAKSIRKCTPLPKGHGRLIDADELKKIIQKNDVMFMTGFNVRICDINATPSIIEADKGE